MLDFSRFNPTQPFSYLSDEAKSFIPGIGDAMAQDKANEANITSAQKQMDFQERMSNSAYQRTMQDMKKAGLNPMLAFSQGGASTPTGAAATSQPASKSKLGEFALNSATGLSSARNQTVLADNSLKDSVQNRQLQATQTAKNLADTQRIQVETQIAKKGIPRAQLEHDLTKEGGSIIKNIMDRIRSTSKEPLSAPVQLDRTNDKEDIRRFKEHRLQQQLKNKG